MCGEHFMTASRKPSLVGSSPRVRGTRIQGTVPTQHRGIIPACAGNTAFRVAGSSWPRDHPHVCGEHEACFLDRARAAGSSPRVRGTRVLFRGFWPAHGIIPACAGNTEVLTVHYADVRDHPRVCGEHLLPATCRARLTGSSPRVRGTQPRHAVGDARRGIIPACAGNTAFDSREIIKARDHPRVCGEHATLRVKLLRVSGSSPRVRGTRRVEREPGGCAGIIPACAGNTGGNRPPT